jgi:DNA-binding MarR family transcriptional regulator
VTGEPAPPAAPAAAADPAETAGTGETLPDAFWAVARLLRHQSRESLAVWDVAPSHARALGVLSRAGRLRLSELSDQLHIAPRSTTDVVDTLEARGLVARHPDPDDRRSTFVELTREGVRVSDAIASSRAADGERLFGRLSATDRAHLARILAHLRD